MPRARVVVATLLLVGLALPAGLARADPSADDQQALEQVLAALEAHPPETVEEYRVAFRELGLVGDRALPHLKALLRRYVDGPGFDDLEAHAFLGDRRFHHPIPEDIAFCGHPFLQGVEEANAIEWFPPDEELAWVAAQAALGAMRLHHRRLLEDRRYRAGDQVFANVATDPVYANETLGFTWADPYAVIQVGPPAPDEDLRATVETLRTLYRSLLADYGETLGLRDLMAPWGGGPDAPAHVRSFEDGAPLAVFLYGDPRTFQALALRIPNPPPPGARLQAWLATDGALHVTGSERLAEAAVAQALWWFRRQQSRWGGVTRERDAIGEGFAEWFAAHVAGAEAEGARIQGMRRMAAALAERDRPYPVFRLEQLLTLTSVADVANLAASAWGLPALPALELFRDQSWAFVRMLQEEPHRASLLAYLRAWLRRETQFGMAQQVFRRTFDLLDDAAWEALEARWERYLREVILDEAVEDASAPAAAARPARLHVRVRGTEDGTEVLVWSPLLARDVVPPARLGAEHEQPVRRLLPVYTALDAVPPDPAGARPPVRLVCEPGTARPVPTEDVRLVLYALLFAGYEDIELDDALPPAIRAELDAWNAAAGLAR